MIEQNYRIDMIPDGAPVVVHISQYDTTARRLSFELYNGGVAYELPAGAVASIAGTKPDNTSFLYAMTVSGNLVSIDLQQQMALVAGDVPAEIQITGATGKIGSANFVIRDERGPIDENSVISETDLPIFEQLVSDAQTAANEAQTAAEDAADAAAEVAAILEDNAGSHNSLYRGKSLGNAVTDEQLAEIEAGTFKDLYIGDYWTIGAVNWRIAGFDYWLHTGDKECTTHHLVIVPDTILYSAQMNTSNVTTGAYVGSAMYTSNLAQAKTTIKTAFGDHILNHREYLQNAVSGNYESGGTWYDSTVELMNERMVYGCDIFHGSAMNNGTSVPNWYSIDKSQLPLFRLDHSRITNRAFWWLRDVVNSAEFAIVAILGNASYTGADASLGVRPAFGICK